MSKPNVPAVLNTVGDLRVGTADSRLRGVGKVRESCRRSIVVPFSRRVEGLVDLRPSSSQVE